MHQIIGLRPYYNSNTGRHQKTDTQPLAAFSSIKELLEDPQKIVVQIPEDQRWDLYYTASHTTDNKREFLSQDIIAFDIDHVDLEKLSQYGLPIVNALEADLERVGLVASGNGIHVIILLETPFNDPGYFDKFRPHYKACCAKIKVALAKAALPGDPDEAIFDARRILRLPETENRKRWYGPDKAMCSPEEGARLPKKWCRVLKGGISPQPWNLVTASGLPQVAAIDQIPAQMAKKLYPNPDAQAVLEGCEFLKACKEDPNAVSEHQWYAMLSITGRLEPDGRDISHAYSQGHRGYSHSETESKIDQALTASGPRTCKNIHGLWGKCETCPHFGNVTSPIAIRGPEFIATAQSGFYNVSIDINGNTKYKPAYTDLIKQFRTDHSFKVIIKGAVCLVWTGSHWEEFPKQSIETYALDHFRPEPLIKIRLEFTDMLLHSEQTPPNWFVTSITKKSNFKNGVLDLETMTLSPHSTDYGFRNCLDFDYDPLAECPQFENFLLQVFDGDLQRITLLLEYLGYCFSNDDCWLQQIVLLIGEGANGKSTLLDVIKSLAGRDNYSSLSMQDMQDATRRCLLDGKLFNVCEEESGKGFKDSETFKALAAGGEMLVRYLYKNPYTIKNKAKFIFACNRLPSTPDTSDAFFRRLAILRFNRVFKGSDRDPFILEKLVTERPGIFNLIMRHYQALKASRKLTESPDVLKELEDYKTDLDSVRSWFESCVELEPLTSTVDPTTQQLFGNYKIYCKESEIRPKEFLSFAKRIKAVIPDYEKRCARPRLGAHRLTTVRGVRAMEWNANY